MKRPLSWVIGIILLSGLSWSGFWVLGNFTIKWVVRDFIAQSAQHSIDTSCQGQAISGFPMQLKFNCDSATIHAGSNDLKATIKDVYSAALLYKPGHITAQATGPLSVRLPLTQRTEHTLNATWQNAQAKLRVGFSGIKQTSFNGKAIALDVTAEQATPLFEQLQLKNLHLDIQPNPDDIKHFDIVLTASQLAVKRNGRALPLMDATFRVQAQNIGEVLNFNPDISWRNWLQSGGKFNIKTATFQAQGFVADFYGALQLSKAGLLSGDITLEISNIEELPKLILDIAPRFHTSAEQLAASLKGFAQSSGQPDKIIIPLTIQDNIVRAGFLPIARIPALF